MADVERVQTGIRLEKRGGTSLGDLVEGIALHVMEGRIRSAPGTLATVAKLKEVDGLDPSADESLRLVEVRCYASEAEAQTVTMLPAGRSKVRW